MEHPLNKAALALALLLTSPVSAMAAGVSADTKQVGQSKRGTSELGEPPPPAGEVRDVGCLNGTDDRSSDLCAQWKAADAAVVSARAADRTVWIGLVGLLLGAFTLFFAAKAAMYAKKAAQEAEEGVKATKDAIAEAKEANNIAREATARQLRPYLIFSEGLHRIGPSDRDVWTVHVSVRLKNFGVIPARIRRYGIVVWYSYVKRPGVVPIRSGEKTDTLQVIGSGSDLICNKAIGIDEQPLLGGSIVVGIRVEYDDGVESWHEDTWLSSKLDGEQHVGKLTWGAEYDQEYLQIVFDI